MKILFVNPEFPQSLWSYEGLADILGVRAGHTPIGLITVAALTIPGIAVEVADENCFPVPLETNADVVAIGCCNVQFHRARMLAEEFHKRGKIVVVGGPYPSLCPERFKDGLFDVVFEGEAEETWPRFCRDLTAGKPESSYRQPGNVDISKSPVPRFDLLNLRDYLYCFVQTTRGCPFQCEFCDIIITDGRVPRTKAVSRVVEEIKAAADLGARYVVFSDANLLANPKYAEELCIALRDFGRERGFPLSFSAEMTVNLAEHPRLMELMRAANFTGVFLGIESPRIDSLIESKKSQNVRRPLLESLRKIQSHNLMITAGMIVGFDSDDARIFQEQFDFLTEAGIPFTTCGMLVALERTPLYARLERESRLLKYDSAERLGHGSADINFVPKQMTVAEMEEGYNWLIRALYKRENYGLRLARSFSEFQPCWERRREARGEFDFDGLAILRKALRHFVLTTDSGRRRFFLRTLWQALRTRPSIETLVTALGYLIAHKHFHKYVTAAHGDPETVADRSPFGEDVLRSKRKDPVALGTVSVVKPDCHTLRAS